MKTITLLTLSILVSGTLSAFPPAPHHEIYGTVRDEQGTPLSGGASVSLIGTSGEIVSGQVSPSIEPGVNYSLKVPMDAGTIVQLYQANAIHPATPFTAEVIIGGVTYLPIEVQGGFLAVGDPGGRTRLDLTLGVDSDGDGLPDAWEQGVISATAGLDDLSDLDKDGDADSDGVSNYIEYLAGTYAFDRRAVFRLEMIEVADGMTHLRFLAVQGRTYSISASSDASHFERVPFSLESDGSDERELHSADSIRFQDVYLPSNLADKRFFRLHVH